MKPSTSFESKVLGAFGAATLVVAVLAAGTWKLSSDATDAAAWVTHTHQVLGNLAATRSTTLQIELSTQSYRITGDPAHIGQRDASMAEREDALQTLARLTADNPSQRDRLRQLRDVLVQRIAISQKVQQLRTTEGAEAANAFAASAPLRETRERTHRLLRDMEVEESHLLEERSEGQRRTHRTLVTTGALLALALVLLLSANYVLIRRQLRVTRLSQQALANSEEDLATTLHSIGDAVLATDAEGRITRMNPVAEKLTGWRMDEAQGLPVDEVMPLIHERTREKAELPVNAVLASGVTQAMANHVSLLSRDGKEHPIADSAAPIRDDAGKLRGVVLVFRDVRIERTAERLILEQNELLEQRVRERTAQLRESEDHLRGVIRNVPALIAYVDAQQRYVYVNDQYRQRFAPNRADLTGCSVREILGDERYAMAAPLIDKALRGEPQNYDWQPFPGVWQAIHYAPRRDDQGEVIGYYVLGTDITGRKTAEGRIQTLNQSLAQHVHDLEHVSRALRTLSAGNRTMLRATDEQELLENMCRAIVDAGGYDTAVVWYCQDNAQRAMRPMAQHGFPGGLAGLHEVRVSWADDRYGRGAVGSAIRTNTTRVAHDLPGTTDYAPWRELMREHTSAIACPLRVGDAVIGALAIYDAEPHAFGPDEMALLTESADDLAFGIATLRARAEQHRTQESMYRLSHFDALTGLPNETRFTEQLANALTTAGHEGRNLAVLQANIERLSEINDALGFSQGDAMLREFARRLRSIVPANAAIARLRGDEFALLLPDCGAGQALDLVAQLQVVLQAPFPVAGIALDLSARVGIALFPEHGSTPHDLYRHMDIAVRQAKKAGTSHAVFDPAQNPDHSRRLVIASELRQAIENGQLQLHLQPKVDMRNGQLRGAEGLVRWKHPRQGLIPPIEFIPLAESTGLIKPLTEWVVDAAAHLIRQWSDEGRQLPIAVNLSARNLRDDRLLERIRHLLTSRGIPEGLLEVEITESTVMEDAEFALRVLHNLRAEGIPLYIDDFGTGYSSLAYLQKLPVDYIKIDQSFVRAMATDKDAERIVRSTIDLIHDLGRKAVAEGIENQDSWNHLAALGCDMAQGYFIARPMPADAFREWVETYRPLGAPSTRPH